MGVKAKKSGQGISVLMVVLVFVLVPFLVVRAIASGSSDAEPGAARSATEGSFIPLNPASGAEPDAAEPGAGGLLDGYAVVPDGSFGRSYAKDSRGVYELTGPVMDTAGILDEGQYYELNSFLWNFYDKTGAQIVVLTVLSLDGEAIESFSERHASAWQLGQAGVDNGVLLTVAMQDRAVRIETGYGAEGTLTDAQCARIIRNVIVPAFGQGDYAGGILEAVRNMAGLLAGDESMVTVRSTGGGGDQTAAIVAMALFFAFFLFILIFALTHSSSVTSASVGGVRVRTGGSSSLGLSGGGGVSFHGGGGSFGGGGASGHW